MNLDKKKYVQTMFDSISKKYDFLNHLLSAGIDFYWRRKALKLTGLRPEAKLLDVACGTGDFANDAHKKFGVKNIVGADLSLKMLKLFNKKFNYSQGRTIQAVAEQMPFKDSAFTNITVAFGVRNFYDIKQGFLEFHRVLEKDGKATILEFKMPQNFLIKKIYDFYFSRILPLIGKIISSNPEAYKYLPESVHSFDKKIDLKGLLYEAGFSNVEYYTLTFGLVQVAIAEK